MQQNQSTKKPYRGSETMSQFVAANYSSMTISQMADAKNVSTETIDRYVRHLKLKRGALTRNTNWKTPETIEFIERNYDTLTLYELARSAGVVPSTIRAFVKELRKKAEPKPFQRPPAVYSNPQYHLMY